MHGRTGRDISFLYYQIGLGCFLLICSIVIYGVIQLGKTASKDEVDAIENTINPYAISMKEAVDIAGLKAKEYYSNLLLTEIHSYDNDTVRCENAGIDGMREWWYVNFANEQGNYVSVLIHGQTIIAVEQYEENGNQGLFTIENIKINCAEAVSIARNLGIRGGNPDVDSEWVSGYNFQIGYGSLSSSPENRILLVGVIGVSDDGSLSRVYVDGMTGEILIAEKKGNTGWEEIQ